MRVLAALAGLLAGLAASPSHAAMRMAAAQAAITFSDPATFSVKRCWPLKDIAGVPGAAQPAGLLFSPGGETLYVATIHDASGNSRVYWVPVNRTANGVTSFGVATTCFTYSANVNGVGLDAGLEFRPGGRLFFSILDTGLLGERLSSAVVAPCGSVSHSLFDLHDVGLSLLSGITFSPVRTDSGMGFGRMQVNSISQWIYEVPLNLSGSFCQPTPAYLFAALTPVADHAISALQYVPGGTYAGDLLFANTDVGELGLVMIDAATGLAYGAGSVLPMLGTTDAVKAVLASGMAAPAPTYGGPIGLEFDASSPGDLFVSTFDGTPANAIIQIGGFNVTATTTTTTSTTTTSVTTSSTTMALRCGDGIVDPQNNETCDPPGQPGGPTATPAGPTAPCAATACSMPARPVTMATPTMPTGARTAARYQEVRRPRFGPQRPAPA